MRLPKQIDANWIDSLDDEELMNAEAELHAAFSKHDRKERALRGAFYELLKGPDALMKAWGRWSVVNNATRERKLRTRTRVA